MVNGYNNDDYRIASNKKGWRTTSIYYLRFISTRTAVTRRSSSSSSSIVIICSICIAIAVIILKSLFYSMNRFGIPYLQSLPYISSTHFNWFSFPSSRQ